MDVYVRTYLRAVCSVIIARHVHMYGVHVNVTSNLLSISMHVCMFTMQAFLTRRIWGQLSSLNLRRFHQSK